MRLAWFTPWPPDPSGIAGRSAELVPGLAALGYAVDVFVDERRVPTGRHPDGPPEPGLVRVASAHDFVWRRRRGQYDLVVYQVGNSRLHEFLWPYLFRWPGLAVLHDARLHHARGRALVTGPDPSAFRAEFTWNHPDVAPEAAELVIAGLDGPHVYLWPMTRAVVAASRLVATHARGAVDIVAGEWPDAQVEYIALGEGRATPPSDAFRRDARSAFDLPNDSVLFGVFGGLTAEKRLPQILRAFAATRGRMGRARLVLAGRADASLDLDAQLDALDLGSVTHRLFPADDAAFDAAVAAVDVSLNLRWPTALETSGPWVRALAAGRATVIVDLVHHGHLPTVDPRTWRPPAPALRQDARAPLAVAIDILDEEHSLRRAMVRLAWDAGFRAELGKAAREHWEREHHLDRMVTDYVRVLALAAAAPPPSTRLPPHLHPDPWAHARRVAESVGAAIPSDLLLP